MSENTIMSLEQKIMEKMKDAMRSKNEGALRGLRAIKSAILLAKTEPGATDPISEADEIKLLTKMQKQRKDSLTIYNEQGRADLAQKEIEELEIIEQFLPEQLSSEDLKQFIAKVIADTGASGIKDMGKVMGIASKELAGKAEGKLISEMVKSLLGA